MSQSAPSSPGSNQKAKPPPVKLPPPRPPKRQTSVMLDVPTSLVSFSDSEAPRTETNKTSITACVPEYFNSFWDIVNECLKWEPTESAMPLDIQGEYFDLIQLNRKHQEKIRIDTWVRDTLNEHFSDIDEHCDDITTGKIAKPMGNDFVLSLTEPSQLGFRRFWVDCVIGNQEKHKLARRSVNEFMNVVAPRFQNSRFAPASFSSPTTPVPGLPVYKKVSEKISGKLDELARLCRYMAGMVHEMETTPLGFGMKYKPLAQEEREIIDGVIAWAESIANCYTFDPTPRQTAIDYVRSAKSRFSGDRLASEEVRFREWGVSEDTVEQQNPGPPHPVSGTTTSLPGPTEGHQKTVLIRHIYRVERHVCAIWRELFLGIELCLDAQLACHQWYHVMQARYHDTVRKIKDTRRRPDMRLYIGLKEQRAGRKLNRWG
ncbi:hypothetical protein TWF281_000114 [Arthrobotrys megalospora]